MSPGARIMLFVLLFALLAHAAFTFVLWSRRSASVTWRLLCLEALFGWSRSSGWLWLVLSDPHRYDRLSPASWVAIVSQVAQSFVMWALALRVLDRKGRGR